MRTLTGEVSARRNQRTDHGLMVALLGPDGAGKTTLIRRLEADPELAVRSIYMGINPPARRTALPSPRWLRQHRPGTGTSLPPVLAQAAKLAAFAHLVIEQWLCYAAARRHRSRGGVVVFDRYVFDVLTPLSDRSSGVRLRKRLLRWGAPDPDLVVVLDAPSDVLLARKKEHPADRLERMRGAYRSLAGSLPNGVVVDASRDAAAVADEVRSLILARGRERAPAGMVSP